jgi:hypothetical protein
MTSLCTDSDSVSAGKQTNDGAWACPHYSTPLQLWGQSRYFYLSDPGMPQFIQEALLTHVTFR